MNATHVSNANQTPVTVEHVERAANIRLNDGIVHQVPIDSFIVTDQMGRQVVWHGDQFRASFTPITVPLPAPQLDPLEIVATFLATERKRHEAARELLEAVAALHAQIVQLRQQHEIDQRAVATVTRTVSNEIARNIHSYERDQRMAAKAKEPIRQEGENG